jgi:CheY-like chemotaxis protein
MTGSTKPEDIHATGQPDTPIEVLTALLTKALQQQTLEQQRTYVQQALDIAAGLDAYLDKISSPPSKVRTVSLLGRELSLQCRLCGCAHHIVCTNSHTPTNGVNALLQVVQELVAASLRHDWAGVHAAGKTQFLQKAECCSGTLEGRLLRFLVAATGGVHLESGVPLACFCSLDGPTSRLVAHSKCRCAGVVRCWLAINRWSVKENAPACPLLHLPKQAYYGYICLRCTENKAAALPADSNR